MATKKQDADVVEATQDADVVEATQDADVVEAVCLLNCGFGECGEVVTISKEELKTGVEQGQLDSHADAIAYAKAK